MSTSDLIRIRPGRVEAAAAVALYGLYELVRGFGGEDWTAARLHTADIVALERSLGVFWEQGIQTASTSVPGLARLLGVLYITLHFVATIALLVWVHRRRPDAFGVVRTTLVAATGLALVGYLAFPAAPPRLAGLGFTDTVTKSAGVNLSSDLLGALYNPLAAVPSLHFGYALLVGVSLAVLARRRWVRIVGALYPAAMLYIIVATGNHFFVDALLGGAVVVAGWFVARALARAEAPSRKRDRAAAYA
jgi:PAP2 superfamily protein